MFKIKPDKLALCELRLGSLHQVLHTHLAVGGASMGGGSVGGELLVL